MTWASNLIRGLFLWFLTSGCNGGNGPADSSAPPDPDLPWDQDREDIPEYSLGRLLISDADSPQLTIFDLDSELVAGTLPLNTSSALAGASGRYSYAHDARDALLHVVDPGQWLLSHIDHFHIVKSELQVRAEQLQIFALSSITSHESWIAAVDSQGGTVSIFQERSITAMNFAPTVVPIEPHVGVAIVSHAHVLVSDLSSGGWGISIRDALVPDEPKQHALGCSESGGIAATANRVVVACREGLLALDWQADSATFAVTVLERSFEEGRSLRVRSHEASDLFVFDRGARKLAALTQGGVSEVRFDADVLDFHVRRQGTAVAVLTSDGKLHEVTVSDFKLTRSLELLDAYEGDAARAPRFVLSHAYAYVADARQTEVLAVRLTSWELETRLPVGGAPLGISMGGMPSNYTDTRE